MLNKEQRQKHPHRLLRQLCKLAQIGETVVGIFLTRSLKLTSFRKLLACWNEARRERDGRSDFRVEIAIGCRSRATVGSRTLLVQV